MFSGDELLVPWSMSTYMEAHTEDHSSPAKSALVYGRTAVAIDSRKVSQESMHLHEFEAICEFLLNSVGNDEISCSAWLAQTAWHCDSCMEAVHYSDSL